MYQAKTPGFLELLMNALTVPLSRRTHRARRIRVVPRRREAAARPSAPDLRAKNEMYFETAWLSRWNR